MGNGAEGRAGERGGLRARRPDCPPARSPDGGVPRSLRRPPDAGAGDLARQARLDRHDDGGRGRVLAPGVRVLAVHRLVQPDGPTGRQPPAGTCRRRLSRGRAGRGAIRRRGHALPPGRAARARAPLVRSPAAARGLRSPRPYGCVRTATLVAPRITSLASRKRTKIRFAAGSKGTTPAAFTNTANVGVSPAL